jgi:hypothetical protein
VISLKNTSMEAALWSVCFFACTSLASSLSRIYVAPDKGGRFVDDLGRIRLFRGLNFVEKQFPWYDKRMLDASLIEVLAKEGGFNLVRLGVMWSGIEPEKEQINESYVDILKVLI